MSKINKIVLITGCAGFIGAALAKRFLNDNFKVIGIDNINDYYDQNLKLSRLKDIKDLASNKTKDCWSFYKISIDIMEALEDIFLKNKPDIVVNLAAQAGIRFSIKNPDLYFQSNLKGFFNILENCRKYKIGHLVYASSSSVYGTNLNYPFSEKHNTNTPLSFYAASKISNEMMAYSYSNIYNLPITGLRYFTVYGPWGRPDMAPMIFSRKIFLKQPITLFNYGNMSRDFTYIDDIVEGTYLCSLKPPNLSLESNNKSIKVPNKIFNIGFGKPVNLDYFVELLENQLSISALKKYESIQPGDVVKTFADTTNLEKWINYKPKVSIEDGVKRFAKWFLDYYS